MKFAKLLHIIAGSVWLGGVVIALALLIGCLGMEQAELITQVSTIPWIYSRVVAFAALFLIAEGLYYGFRSKWGFVKHGWIALKWLLLIIMIPLTALTITSIALVREQALQATTWGGWTECALPLALLAAQVVVLLAMMVLSVYKPRHLAAAATPSSPSSRRRPRPPQT